MIIYNPKDIFLSRRTINQTFEEAPLNVQPNSVVITDPLGNLIVVSTASFLSSTPASSSWASRSLSSSFSISSSKTIQAISASFAPTNFVFDSEFLLNTGSVNTLGAPTVSMTTTPSGPNYGASMFHWYWVIGCKKIDGGPASAKVYGKPVFSASVRDLLGGFSPAVSWSLDPTLNGYILATQTWDTISAAPIAPFGISVFQDVGNVSSFLDTGDGWTITSLAGSDGAYSVLSTMVVNTASLAYTASLAQSAFNSKLPVLTLSSKGIANGSSSIPNNGANFGPDTPGTTTVGIQEALNSLPRNAVSTVGSASINSGGTLLFEPGLYTYTTPLVIPGTGSIALSLQGSDWANTILNYSGSAGSDAITNQQTGSGLLWLRVNNLSFTYAPLSKNYIMNFLNVGNLYFFDFLFGGSDLIKNGAFDNTIGLFDMTAQSQYIVGLKCGSVNYTDFTAGVGEFHRGRFWNIAAGMLTTMDHQIFRDTSFAFIGGSNKYSPTANQWTVSGSFLYPDSALAYHAGIVDLSLLGDTRLLDCSYYFTWCALFRGNSRGTPMFVQTTPASLESSAWIILMVPEAQSGSIAINSYTSDANLLQGVSVINKTAAISQSITASLTYQIPTNLSLNMGNDYWQGNTEYLVSSPQWFDPLTSTRKVSVNLGGYGGVNRFQGNHIIDQLSVGTGVNPAYVLVGSGSDAGINGYYTASAVSHIIAGANFNPSSYVSANGQYYIVLNDDLSGNGGIYSGSDPLGNNELYFNGSNNLLAPGYRIPYDGQYIANAGLGTPPVVRALLTTYPTIISGPLSCSANLTASQLLGTASYANISNNTFPYQTVATSSLNWITASFSNKYQVVSLPITAAYSFTASNVPVAGNVSYTILCISHSATMPSSSLSFPSNWVSLNAGSWPSFITASKVAYLTLFSRDGIYFEGTWNQQA